MTKYENWIKKRKAQKEEYLNSLSIEEKEHREKIIQHVKDQRNKTQEQEHIRESILEVFNNPDIIKTVTSYSELSFVIHIPGYSVYVQIAKEKENK